MKDNLLSVLRYLMFENTHIFNVPYYLEVRGYVSRNFDNLSKLSEIELATLRPGDQLRVVMFAAYICALPPTYYVWSTDVALTLSSACRTMGSDEPCVLRRLSSAAFGLQLVTATFGMYLLCRLTAWILTSSKGTLDGWTTRKLFLLLFSRHAAIATILLAVGGSMIIVKMMPNLLLIGFELNTKFADFAETNQRWKSALGNAIIGGNRYPHPIFLVAAGLGTINLIGAGALLVPAAIARLNGSSLRVRRTISLCFLSFLYIPQLINMIIFAPAIVIVTAAFLGQI